MELNPRQVEAFRAVMVTGSMTAAAEILRVTQPAVSRLIKDLELELKFRLFRRDGNRLIPTQEGTILFAEVDRFYLGMERVAKIASELRHTRAGSLRIAAITTLSLSCMTEAMQVFRKDRPAVKITLESVNSMSVLDLVAGRHFDIGFAQVVGEFPGVDVTPLPPAEAICVLPSGHPLSEKEVIVAADLAGLPYVSVGKNSPFRIKIDELFRREKIERQEVLETSLAASVVSLVGAGFGVGLVDPFSAKTFANGEYVLRPFQPSLTFDVHAVTPIHNSSRLAREFLRITRSIFSAANRTAPVQNKT